MKKYTWSFNRSDEVWNHDTFDTIEECIKNAIEECGYDVYVYSDEPDKIYIGECRPKFCQITNIKEYSLEDGSDE